MMKRLTDPLDGHSSLLGFDFAAYAGLMAEWMDWLADDDVRRDLGYPAVSAGFEMATDSGRQWRSTQELVEEALGRGRGPLVQVCADELRARLPAAADCHERYWAARALAGVYRYRRTGIGFPPAMYDETFIGQVMLAMRAMAPRLKGKGLLA